MKDHWEEELTERQLHLVQLLACGLPDKGAAHVMFVSYRTYRRELTAAMRKLCAATRAEAVATAIRLGCLVPDGDGWRGTRTGQQGPAT